MKHQWNWVEMFDEVTFIYDNPWCRLWKARVVTEKTEVHVLFFMWSSNMMTSYNHCVPRRAEENLCTHYETLELNLSCWCLSHFRAIEPGTTMNNLDFYESVGGAWLFQYYFNTFHAFQTLTIYPLFHLEATGFLSALQARDPTAHFRFGVQSQSCGMVPNKNLSHICLMVYHSVSFNIGSWK